MDLIHADSNRAEIGVIIDFKKFDAQIHNNCALADNTYTLEQSIGAWSAEKIMPGNLLYIPYTEWGGIVSSVKKDTANDAMTIRGCLWRAMLAKRIIKPPEGMAYMTYTDIELNRLIEAVVGTAFAGLFTFSDFDTGVLVTASFRYNTVLYGLSAALKTVGYTLSCEYDPLRQKAVLSARAIVDYSNEYDISTDLGVDIVASTGRIDDYNHVIALGTGELEERTTLELWLYNGKIYTDRPSAITDVNMKSMIFDYPNAESDEELATSAAKALLACAATASAEIDVSKTTLTLLLDDQIEVIDRDLLITTRKAVAQRILTINSSGEKIRTEVE